MIVKAPAAAPDRGALTGIEWLGLDTDPVTAVQLELARIAADPKLELLGILRYVTQAGQPAILVITQDRVVPELNDPQ